MFFVFIILGWVTPYTADLIPGLEANLLAGGDCLLLASLFVLGGNFWDKIRSVFVYDVKVRDWGRY